MAGLVDKAKEMVADKLAHMEKPTADLTDVGFKDVNRESVGLKSDVLIHNPYDHELPILEITYRLRCGDREITSGSIGDTGNIQANTDTSIEVGSRVAYNFLVNLMRDIGADWDIDYDFDVGVTVKLPIVHKFTIPLHKKGTLKLPTLADIF